MHQGTQVVQLRVHVVEGARAWEGLQDLIDGHVAACDRCLMRGVLLWSLFEVSAIQKTYTVCLFLETKKLGLALQGRQIRSLKDLISCPS